MRILISNDDGYQSQGLKVLARELEQCGEISVVAPDRDRSGASNSLTLAVPVRVWRSENGFVRVEGTPTDCVHIAITGLLEQEPDIVIAGINQGPNLGDDVIYSGTVAAAMEGRFLGMPAMAISIDSQEPKHLDAAARVASRLVSNLERGSLGASTILNVNVPDLPYEQIRGVRATRLGHRHRAEPVSRVKDPRGNILYWVGPAGSEQDAGPGTDFHAVRNGYVSVSPLHVDLTRHAALEPLAHWLSRFD
ncbi:MAG: 5'/3'-nucleotidase SurE [Chromatiaceae bacterium]|jgi:5'-nucleotidase|nr:5'/3'-nucleotidase SurE [Chromatiaceae bacterium]